MPPAGRVSHGDAVIVAMQIYLMFISVIYNPRCLHQKSGAEDDGWKVVYTSCSARGLSKDE